MFIDMLLKNIFTEHASTIFNVRNVSFESSEFVKGPLRADLIFRGIDKDTNEERIFIIEFKKIIDGHSIFQVMAYYNLYI